MITAKAKDVGDRYTVKVHIKGNPEELEAETLAILRGIWRQKYGGPIMINSILNDFTSWINEQLYNKEDKRL